MGNVVDKKVKSFECGALPDLSVRDRPIQFLLHCVTQKSLDHLVHKISNIIQLLIKSQGVRVADERRLYREPGSDYGALDTIYLHVVPINHSITFVLVSK